MNDLVVLSAYGQLTHIERVFVDGYVSHLEDEAMKRNERISNALFRPVPARTLAKSRDMFDRPIVVAAINERVNELAMNSELTVNRILKELTSLAFSNISDFMRFDDVGIPTYDFSAATPEQLAAVKSWKETPMKFGGKKYEFTMHDKYKPIETLMRFMGLLESDNPHWREKSARPVLIVKDSDSIDDVANQYAAMIEG